MKRIVVISVCSLVALATAAVILICSGDEPAVAPVKEESERQVMVRNPVDCPRCKAGNPHAFDAPILDADGDGYLDFEPDELRRNGPEVRIRAIEQPILERPIFVTIEVRATGVPIRGVKVDGVTLDVSAAAGVTNGSITYRHEEKGSRKGRAYVTVDAWDEDGNETSLWGKLIFDAGPPKLSILEPTNGAAIAAPDTRVLFRCRSQNASARVFCRTEYGTMAEVDAVRYGKLWYSRVPIATTTDFDCTSWLTVEVSDFSYSPPRSNSVTHKVTFLASAFGITNDPPGYFPLADEDGDGTANHLDSFPFDDWRSTDVDGDGVAAEDPYEGEALDYDPSKGGAVRLSRYDNCRCGG